ncbi:MULTISPECIES: hypothetical protein [Marinobacter]|uniref:Uncharacterized protein n=1 Tax=Marinobacter suaedae TaxID=3057675 RepID=A0ABT8W1U1_9GAMM|nr:MULTISPECIES: hypothetical protein [unclassified Marinobacter]MBZ2168034.1 hypothetical protein [Marinobacter sp. F4216]MDO3722221.1 hypothetical protein [Marinobacter sp. chi1]
MKKLLMVSLLLFSFGVAADEVIVTFKGGTLTCNWGELTADDADTMGEHASDPSGDGKGPNDSDQPRAGLANVVDKGNLEATCAFIRSLLGG